MTSAAPVSPSVLTVGKLCVDARTPEGRRRVLDDVSFDLKLGKRSASPARVVQANR